MQDCSAMWFRDGVFVMSTGALKEPEPPPLQPNIAHNISKVLLQQYQYRINRIFKSRCIPSKSKVFQPIPVYQEACRSN